MAVEEQEDSRIYNVVINHEEQYSIWPAHKTLPPGWSCVGVTGRKNDCLEHIKTVWTDMRPLSVRQRMKSTG
ncbi:MAG TPA: MbtH family NRPS accessory protein [Candidatus Angelobacter sp.]